jgi:hypothetical protein
MTPATPAAGTWRRNRLMCTALRPAVASSASVISAKSLGSATPSSPRAGANDSSLFAVSAAQNRSLSVSLLKQDFRRIEVDMCVNERGIGAYRSRLV